MDKGFTQPLVSYLLSAVGNKGPEVACVHMLGRFLAV